MGKRILYVNATVRSPSRTDELARVVLSCLSGEVTERKLTEIPLSYMDSARISKRDKDIERGNFDDYPLAKEFASADVIVIAAPHYDQSFPSLLKTYIENIYVRGVVMRFSERGEPIGLCKAKELYYVATSGGPLETRFGYEYIQTLANQIFGIPKCTLFKAEMLDIRGADIDAIMAKAKQGILDSFK